MISNTASNALENLLNGNLTDARRLADRIKHEVIVDTAVEVFGMTFRKAKFAAGYLKGNKSFQEYCNAELSQQELAHK